jgi:hypothetical protein
MPTTRRARRIQIHAVLLPLSVAAADSEPVADGASVGELSTGLGEKLSVGLGSVVGGVVGGSVVSTSVGDCSGLTLSPELSLGIGAAVSVGASLGRPLGVGRWLGATPPDAIEDTAAFTLALPSSVQDPPNSRTDDASASRPAKRATRPTRGTPIGSNPRPIPLSFGGGGEPVRAHTPEIWRRDDDSAQSQVR